MFDALSNRLQDVFQSLQGRGPAHARRPSSGALREIRARAARGRRQLQGRQGVRRPRARAGARPRTSCTSLTPASRSSRSSATSCSALFGDAKGGLHASAARSPRVILMLGLQGSGKTTTTGKLARVAGAGRAGTRSLVSTDVRRPAAIEQLTVRRRARPACACTTRPASSTRWRARRGALAEARNARLRRRHRRHRGPAAHRRRADGRARGDQGRRRGRPTCSTSPTR